MVTRVMMNKEMLRLDEVLRKFSGYTSEQLSDIRKALIKVIDNDNIEASYQFLKEFNDDIEKSYCDAVNFEDIKDSLVEIAKRRLLVSKVDLIFKGLNNKSFSELEEIESKEYASFLDTLKIFWHGKELVSELYKSMYGINKEEMQSFFSSNGVKKSSKNGYIGYMSIDLIKYHIALINIAKCECLKLKDDIEDYSDMVSSSDRTTIIKEIRKIGFNIKELYQFIYKKTPFDDLKEGAFAQETLKGMFPDR